jgi:DNA-binding transcriptional MerR regulator
MLRRYGREGLLAPAAVDSQTRYRWYTREQVSTALLIRYLRLANVSVPEIKRLLNDEPNPVLILHEHRRRLREERRRLRERIKMIDRLTHHASSVVAEGLLDSQSVDLLTPTHYLASDGEIMLETTEMTIEDAMRAETLLCGFYDIKWLQFTYEPETRSEWTILFRDEPAAT